ncbi:MAG: 1,4-dihydroxy-2-naphthoate polyprenyltransferase [Rhabdochlamydiaceae bacterium]
MNTLQIWAYATRPKTLVIGISPVLIGTTLALSQGVFNPTVFLFTLLTTLCIQIGTNLANDYFDFIKGSDTTERKGFMRVVQAGLVLPATMKKVVTAVFAIAILCGCYLIWIGGLPIAILLSLSIALGVLYTGGPFPLAYLGLGEIFAFLFFGPIAVLGTYYLQTGIFCKEALIIGLSPGAFSMAILIINNVRDVDEDRLASKKTIAVRLGRAFGKYLYLFSLLLTFFPLLFCYPDHPFVLVTLLTLFPAIPLMRTMLTHRDPRLLNPLFVKTGQLQGLFTLLFCIGWLL